jgi:acetyl esterase
MRKSIEAYVPDTADRASELASARNISTKNAKKQPPTLIVNSRADPLRNDGTLFGEILQTADVDCAIITTHEQLHDSSVLEATRRGATPKTVIALVAHVWWVRWEQVRTSKM